MGVALAGGGSWGAFTSGVLHALIEKGVITEQNLEAISGTSAGAANAAMLSHSANSSTLAKAPALFNTFWRKVVEHGEKVGLRMMPTALGEKFPNLNADMLEQGKQTIKLLQAWGMASQPGTLESKIESVIGTDWGAIQNGPIKTYIGTARVSSSRGTKAILHHKTFEGRDISPKVIAASGTLVGTTKVSNDYYVDGAYLKNPSMDELEGAPVTDIIAIVLYPQPKGPITAAHEDSISPGKTKFIGPEVYQELAWLSQNSGKNIHVIDMPHEPHWNETSKMNISREWVSELYQRGYQAGLDWAAKNAHKIGKASTFRPAIAQACAAPAAQVSTKEFEIA